MRSFTDSKGRAWDVAVNIATVKLVRQLLNVDLYRAPRDGFKLYEQVVGDPCTLVDVLYVLCKRQADALGVSDVDFGTAMHGNALLAAESAFTEELIDFFPDPLLRKGMRTIIGKAREMNQLMEGLLVEAAESLPSTRTESNTSGSSGSGPAPSASTPAPSPPAKSSTSTAAGGRTRGSVLRRLWQWWETPATDGKSVSGPTN